MILLSAFVYSVGYMFLVYCNDNIYMKKTTVTNAISFYNGAHLIAVSIMFLALGWSLYVRFRLLNVSLR